MDQREYDKAFRELENKRAKAKSAEREMASFLKEAHRENQRNIAQIMQESLKGDQSNSEATKIINRMTGFSTDGNASGFSRGDDQPVTGREERLWDRE